MVDSGIISAFFLRQDNFFYDEHVSYLIEQ